jgi:hypothetical protein
LRKTFEHTAILEINHNSRLFVSQCWHLNRQGKEMLDKQVTSHIYTILEKPVTLPVSPCWKTEKYIETNTV